MLSVLVLAGSVLAAPAPFHPKVFDFNLDLRPEDRWNEIIDYYKADFPYVLEYFNKQLPREVLPLIEEIGRLVDPLFGVYGREMKGIAARSGVDLGMIVPLNVLYELRDLGPGHVNQTGGHVPPPPFPPSVSPPTGELRRPDYTNGRQPGMCTSIVASAPDHTVVHGRNLDWNLPNRIRNMTFECHFKRNGTLLFRGVCIAGYVGVLTGMVPGKFTGSINERLLGGDVAVDALTALIEGAGAVTHVMRKALEAGGDYSATVSTLANARLAAPVYYTVGGMTGTEGTVLTRDRLSTVRPRSIEMPSTWYVLETNYDWWLAPPEYDDRRAWGVAFMNRLGTSGVTTDSIATVMGEWPLNNNFTSYSAVMSAASGAFDVLIRFI